MAVISSKISAIGMAESYSGFEERLGMVSYANVAPLFWGLQAVEGLRFVSGVPTELNKMLLSDEIDLTLMSSIEFLRHRTHLLALPDFSVSTLGSVYSVMLFHWKKWTDLDGAKIAISTDSATSVALLRVLFQKEKLKADFRPAKPVLSEMLSSHDAALLIGDAALIESLAKREFDGRRPHITDLGARWNRLTGLPFTFAVLVSKADNPPSESLVTKLRQARETGLASIHKVVEVEARKLGLLESQMRKYLGNFRYYFEPADKEGLFAFGRMALPGFKAKDVRFLQL